MASTSETIIVLTTGKQDRGTRATLAFAWGCTALAMGHKATLYMTMDGTIWSLPGGTSHVQVGGFESLEEYVKQFQELGGEILVCAPCTEYYCSFDGPGSPEKIREGIELTGLASIVGKIDSGTNVVTF